MEKQRCYTVEKTDRSVPPTAHSRIATRFRDVVRDDLLDWLNRNDK